MVLISYSNEKHSVSDKKLLLIIRLISVIKLIIDFTIQLNFIHQLGYSYF